MHRERLFSRESKFTVCSKAYKSNGLENYRSVVAFKNKEHESLKSLKSNNIMNTY